MTRTKCLIETIFKDYPYKDLLEYFPTGSVEFGCDTKKSDFDIVVKLIECNSLFNEKGLYDFVTNTHIHNFDDNHLLSTQFSCMIKVDNLNVNIILAVNEIDYCKWKIATEAVKLCILTNSSAYYRNCVASKIKSNKAFRVAFFEAIKDNPTSDWDDKAKNLINTGLYND